MNASAQERWRRLHGSTRLVVHPDTGRSARSIAALGGASDWRRMLADRAGAAWLTVVGAARLPLADDMGWPTPDRGCLVDALDEALPGFRVLGAVTPRQAGRARLSVLGRMRGNVVVVKLG